MIVPIKIINLQLKVSIIYSPLKLYQNTYQRKTTLTTKDIILLLFRKQGIAKKKKSIKYKNETKKSAIKNE